MGYYLLMISLTTPFCSFSVEPLAQSAECASGGPRDILAQIILRTIAPLSYCSLHKKSLTNHIFQFAPVVLWQCCTEIFWEGAHSADWPLAVPVDARSQKEKKTNKTFYWLWGFYGQGLNPKSESFLQALPIRLITKAPLLCHCYLWTISFIW